ncbi:MAG: response regulator [Verrucomicrobiota bacterium]|nr:response regulator [Verrucomicrobiota bacterium]
MFARSEEPLLRVLLVEDDPDDLLLLREMLGAPGGLRCQITAKERLNAARSALTAEKFDLILSDLSLPDGRGLDAVRALHEAAPMTPLVVLTGLQDEATGMAAIQTGAQDYLTKDKTGASLLVRTLRYAIERARVQERLRAALAEKEILLKEIHHRVKNNMQVISSLLALQAIQVEDPKVRAIFDESQSRIQTMGLIHERLYRSSNLSQIDLPSYLSDLVAMILQTHKTEADIRTDVEVEDVSLGLDVAIPLGLITNELLTNSLKHAFRGQESGIVRLRLHRTNSECEFVLSDSGSRHPPPQKNPNGLGLRLVEVLTQQIKGRIAVDRADGLRYTIRFPAEAAA